MFARDNKTELGSNNRGIGTPLAKHMAQQLDLVIADVRSALLQQSHYDLTVFERQHTNMVLGVLKSWAMLVSSKAWSEYGLSDHVLLVNIIKHDYPY